MNLKPVVQIGKQGLTDTTVKEVAFALAREELIKVRVIAEDRDARAALMNEVATRTGSELCGATGNSAIYFLASDKHRVKID